MITNEMRERALAGTLLAKGAIANGVPVASCRPVNGAPRFRDGLGPVGDTVGLWFDFDKGYGWSTGLVTPE